MYCILYIAFVFYLICCLRVPSLNNTLFIIIEATKTPSTAFCLLLRLLTMRCTTKQMEQMLNHVDSPYIRCIGFLYLRYASEPKELWDWFMPYLYDVEEVKITERNIGYHRQGDAQRKNGTVGDFVRGLLNDLEYYGTRLPRLPLGIEREMKVKLLLEEQIEARAIGHEKDKKTMDYFQKVGSAVRAMYGDEQNEVTWYDAVVDRVIWRDDESGEQYTRPKFVVTFPEYGNTEVVSLGEMDVPGKATRSYGKTSDYREASGYIDNRNQDRLNHRDNKYNRSRDQHNHRDNYDRRHPHHRGHPNHGDNYRRGYERNERDRSRSRDRNHVGHERVLMEEVKQREREKVFAKGRDYSSHPSSFKESISTFTSNVANKRDYSHIDDKRYGEVKYNGKSQEKKQNAFNDKPPPSQSPVKQRSAEEIEAIEAKKRKLMQRYG